MGLKLPGSGGYLLPRSTPLPCASVAFFLCVVAGVQALAGDSYLDPVSRTADERARIKVVTSVPGDFSEAQPFERRSGGEGTDFHNPSRNSFSYPSANLQPARRMDFLLGDGFFRKIWVSTPASTRASDGLGPLYNVRSCQGCHRKDGRGRPPFHDGDDDANLLLRIRAPGGGGDPVYGEQLQTAAVPGLLAEGRIKTRYEFLPIELSGEIVVLRRPLYRVSDLAYGPLEPGTGLSPRIAPPMIGMGLLEAIPEADILAHVDPVDADADGVSGRPRWLPAEGGNDLVLGRFGWKGDAPHVPAQVAKAFLEDIGLGTPMHPSASGGCTETQVDCLAMPHGDTPAGDGVEIPAEAFDLVVFYARNLAVPARRSVDDPKVLRGKEIFHEAGCGSCHVPAFVTHRLPDRPGQNFQLIWPYTDLLLHDMGERLADDGPEEDSLRREWRTPPLWGIGLTEKVGGHFRLLHDGRADGLLEAILWHGGEGEKSRNAVAKMDPADREALLVFLRSL